MAAFLIYLSHVLRYLRAVAPSITPLLSLAIFHSVKISSGFLPSDSFSVFFLSFWIFIISLSTSSRFFLLSLLPSGRRQYHLPPLSKILYSYESNKFIRSHSSYWVRMLPRSIMPAAIAYFNISESLVILSVIFHLWKKDEGKGEYQSSKQKPTDPA